MRERKALEALGRPIGAIGHYGAQPGQIKRADRKVRVQRPRLRHKTEGEVKIPCLGSVAPRSRPPPADAGRSAARCFHPGIPRGVAADGGDGGSIAERDHEPAARSLREGIGEVHLAASSNPRQPAPMLGHDQPHRKPPSGVRRRTHKVSRWRESDMVERWVAAAWLLTEKHFRRMDGHEPLWALAAILGRETNHATVARNLAIKVQPELVLGDSRAVPSGRIAEAVAAGKSIFSHQGTEGCLTKADGKGRGQRFRDLRWGGGDPVPSPWAQPKKN